MNRLLLLLALLGLSSVAGAQQASVVYGDYAGVLANLPIKLHVFAAADGTLSGTLAVRPGARGIPCADFKISGQSLSFSVPAVHATWKGSFSEDGAILTGTWDRGTPLALNMTRDTFVPAATPATFDPAVPPVSAADMQAVLTKDLEQALKTGALAPEAMAGVSIGVLRDGVSRVFAFGTAKPDSIYEIGSITKTFTGLVLAQMIAQAKVTLEEPVRNLLPKDAVPAPTGPEITLLDLVTQHSGLPGLPDNLHPADPSNPYLDYRPADLYSFLRQHGVQKRANAGYLYSNLGLGLLGQALVNRAGKSYPDLVRIEVFVPLGMHDTTVVLSPRQQARFVQGYNANHKPTHSWELDALAGAGAIRSTAADMLIYLNANLHPDQLPAGTAKTREGRTLPAALNQSHELRNDVVPGTRIAFAWMFVEQTQIYWHNGGTGGYSSFAFFNPKDNFAAIVLLNTGPGRGASFADMLGTHILQRFSGKPAISLSSAP